MGVLHMKESQVSGRVCESDSLAMCVAIYATTAGSSMRQIVQHQDLDRQNKEVKEQISRFTEVSCFRHRRLEPDWIKACVCCRVTPPASECYYYYYYEPFPLQTKARC